jgi:hypothetical protein
MEEKLHQPGKDLDSSLKNDVVDINFDQIIF